MILHLALRIHRAQTPGPALRCPQLPLLSRLGSSPTGPGKLPHRGVGGKDLLPSTEWETQPTPTRWAGPSPLCILEGGGAREGLTPHLL